MFLNIERGTLKLPAHLSFEAKSLIKAVIFCFFRLNY